ncbi:MAG TPA: RdgB/HAM1 family non-canonical purine NTP pyrophosphatase [Clostridiales bacterium]|nr:RdgB/HAM1 family non-canonical purine NTP pyrophosphatase [Clostridiales bacterium]
MKFLIASHNLKKRDELRRILSPLGIEVYTAEDLGIVLPEVEENGSTFEENAELKAVSGCEASGLPCIADDSGLVVDALEGRPGIYSARYAGEDTPYSEKIKVLLKEMENVSEEHRTARFVSVICCAFPDGKKIFVRGVCEGKIGFEPKGSNGFGYDPIFYYEGRSFAELSPEEKDAVSHRGKSLRGLRLRLKEQFSL